MALSVAPTAPLSTQPTYVNGTCSMNEPMASVRSEPILRSQIVSPDQGLRQQWQKQAMSSFSASMSHRSRNPSPEVQHARKLLKIAKQQETAGICFDGQLTVTQAKACVNAAEKQANNSISQWLSDFSTEVITALPNIFSLSETNFETTEKPKASWLEEFEGAAVRHFTIKKSPLCKPGMPPKLIVIGDGDHSSKSTQQVLNKLAQFLEQNGAVATLLVEAIDPPTRKACFGIPSVIMAREINPARCIGADLPEAKIKGLKLMREMWDAAFNLADAVDHAAKDAGISHGALNPHELMAGVPKHVYWEIEEAVNKKIIRNIEMISNIANLDATNIQKASKVYIASRNKFYRHMEDSMSERDNYLMKKIDEHYKTEGSIVAVYGDAHVQENANQLLQKYDCWILDDKSSNHNLPKKEKS